MSRPSGRDQRARHPGCPPAAGPLPPAGPDPPPGAAMFRLVTLTPVPLVRGFCDVRRVAGARPAGASWSCRRSTGSSRQTVVLGLVATAPLIAANLVGVGLTAVYGVLASVLAAVLLGFSDHLYDELTSSAGTVHPHHWPSLLAASSASSPPIVASGARSTSPDDPASPRSPSCAILAPIPPRMAGLALAERYTSAAADARIGGDLYAAVDTPVRGPAADRRRPGQGPGGGTAGLAPARRVPRDGRTSATDLLVLLDRPRPRRRRGRRGRGLRHRGGRADRADGLLTIVNAGHPAPLLLRSGIAMVLRPPARRPPLGLPGDPVHSSSRSSWATGC